LKPIRLVLASAFVVALVLASTMAEARPDSDRVVPARL
jgi:hypothetical protein